MSNIAMAGGSTGSGTVTLLAPSTSTNRTINLPDSNGTILTTATAGVPVNGPAFSAYPSSNQSLTTSTWTKVTFNVEEFDTNGNFESSRFTPTVAGYYQINGVTNAGASAAAITRSMVQIYKNGSGYKYGTDVSPSGSNAVVVVSSIVYLNGSTDYVEIYGLITATSPAISASSSLVYFNGAMVRSAV